MRNGIRWIVGVLAVLLLLAGRAGAHGVSVPVIVDTDMGMDDAKALAMLLNMPDIRIPLIVTSDGAVSPRTGVERVSALLRYFKREGTRVGAGKALDRPAPSFRARLEAIPWPEAPGTPETVSGRDSAPDMIVEALKGEDQGLLYVCLGPLTNLAEALRKEPGLRERISWLLYFGGDPAEPGPGWNTERDREAARAVFAAGIQTYSLNPKRSDWLAFDPDLLERIRALGTRAARFACDIHASPEAVRLMEEKHFYIWDELTVLYMTQPDLFNALRAKRNRHVFGVTVADSRGVYDAYVKLLGRPADFHLEGRNAVILKEFPTQPDLFREDVSPHVQEIIDRYGLEEWKACLLTNELHRHLGIYSLVGAKMGIRAREILEAPFDTLNVISYAGTSPPLSCLNDGLQVSTGASLGRGGILVRETDPYPGATFIHGNQRLTLTVKPEWVKKIATDIRAAVKEYGGVNPEYFAYVRTLSVQYWLALDRNEIFEERFEPESGAK